MPLGSEALARLGLATFTVVDVETTGLDPAQDRIIEFGAVRFEGGEPTDSVSQLFNPGTALPGFITALTGITQEEVDYAPRAREALPALLDRWTAGTVAAHNAPFELKFLNAFNRDAGREAIESERCLDTLLLSRALLPTLYNHKLETVAAHLEVPILDVHRAHDDAEATGRALLALVERALALDPKVLELLARLAPEGASRRLFRALEEAAALGRDASADLYERIEPTKWTELPLDLDDRPLRPLSLEGLERALAQDGPLARSLDRFEERAEQQAMARGVAQAFNEGTFLAAEAGTGVGKSFAYLVPAHAWSDQNAGAAGRVVLSTRTKTLQDQLYRHDIPKVREAFGENWNAVLLKGRQNYLCLRRLDALLKEEPGAEERAALMPLVSWLDETDTGDLEEVHALWHRDVRRWVYDDPEYCVGRRCPFHDRCYSIHAREAAKRAQLVVINHALLLADLSLEGGILGDYGHLIVDEAHHLEKSARQAMQRGASYWHFKGVFDELLRSDELGRETGVLALLKRQIPADAAELAQRVEALAGMLAELRRETSGLFGQLTDEVAGPERARPEYTLRRRYGPDAFVNWTGSHAALLEALEAASVQIQAAADAAERALGESAQEAVDALNAAAGNLELLRGEWDWLFRAEDETHVFWFELPNRSQSLLQLHAAPLDVGESLQPLYERLRTAVFTSATLSVGGDFAHFRARVGLDRLPEGQLRSQDFAHPYDHASAVHLSVPTYLPEPNERGFAEALGELLFELASYAERRTLALFTSYKLLRAVQEFLRDKDLFVRAQGPGEPRSRVLAEFRNGPPAALLLGTDSFWEGVDLPGDALEILVLTKLPFPVPTDPLVAAEEERLGALGRSAFAEYSLPQAVLALRQGFGRLIRSKTDRGAVVITDVRVVNKGYGKHFLGALPCEAHTYFTSSALVTDVKRFLDAA